MAHRTLAFDINGEFLGVAFTDLPSGPLYPAVSAVYGDSEISLVYRASGKEHLFGELHATILMIRIRPGKFRYLHNLQHFAIMSNGKWTTPT